MMNNLEVKQSGFRYLPLAMLLMQLLALGGCSSLPDRPMPSRDGSAPAPQSVPPATPQAAPQTEPDQPGARQPVAPPTVLGDAAQRLYLAAKQASAAGRDAEAATLLERALRIAPRHPLLWHNLAVVRFNQGNYAQADSLARKSNSLANHDRNLRSRNWRLIAAAQRGLGQPQQAAEAEARADGLER